MSDFEDHFMNWYCSTCEADSTSEGGVLHHLSMVKHNHLNKETQTMWVDVDDDDDVDVFTGSSWHPCGPSDFWPALDSPGWTTEPESRRCWVCGAGWRWGRSSQGGQSLLSLPPHCFLSWWLSEQLSQKTDKSPENHSSLMLKNKNKNLPVWLIRFFTGRYQNIATS